MKVLQVIEFFSPLHGGGSIEVVYQLSRALAQAGHEVTIYTSNFELDQEYIDSLEGVKVYPFRGVQLGRLGFGFYFAPGMIHKLRRDIKGFDIVHMHNYITFQNLAACHYANKYDIPCVLQAHGGIARVMGKQMINRMFDILFGYRILKGASKVIAVSDREVKEYEQAGVDHCKITTIPHGLGIESFNSLPAPGEFRERNNIKEKWMVLFLGRIHKIKGLAFLVESFSELVKEIKDVVLVIAGPDAGYEKELRMLIKTKNCHDKVRFTGYLGGREKMSAYADADVLVCPSIYEVFGLVPFEAIMCGTPAIVTDVCGCSEWIRKSGAGYLIKYGDVLGLKETIIKCLTDNAEVKKMIRQGKEYIGNNLHWAQVAREIENIYAACISQEN